MNSKRQRHTGGIAIEFQHHIDGPLNVRWRCLTALDCGRNQPDTERLGQNHSIADNRTAVLLDISWLDDSGDSIAEFDFVIPNRVTANQCHASLIELV